MQDAVKKAARLHRDISIGNIILVRKSKEESRTGYLIDWDASCDVDDSGEANEAGRAVRFVLQFSRPRRVSNFRGCIYTTSPLSETILIRTGVSAVLRASRLINKRIYTFPAKNQGIKAI